MTATLAAGNADMTLSVDSPTSGTVTLHCEGGTVTGIDTAIANGWAKGMPGDHLGGDRGQPTAGRPAA